MIGVDLCKISRVEGLLERHPEFLTRVFTEEERLYIEKKGRRPETVAGLYAAKEALAKASGLGMAKGGFYGFQIFHRTNGAPFGLVRDRFFALSISHDGDWAVAVAEGDSMEGEMKVPKDWKGQFFLPPEEGHKYTTGAVFIRAGSVGMTGAAILCASAAFRSGAGYVGVCLPQEALSQVTAGIVEAVTIPLGEEDQMIDKAKVLVAGPGMGREDAYVKKLLQRHKPTVLDADALYPLEGSYGGAVITPHEGEFSRLTGKDFSSRGQREEEAYQFAKEREAVVVLKGPKTYVTDGVRQYRNTTGNSLLATAGAGDVLTGFIAGLLCRTKDPFLGAAAAVYLHGFIADLYYHEGILTGLRANDLIKKAPGIFSDFFRLVVDNDKRIEV